MGHSEIPVMLSQRILEVMMLVGFVESGVSTFLELFLSSAIDVRLERQLLYSDSDFFPSFVVFLFVTPLLL